MGLAKEGFVLSMGRVFFFLPELFASFGKLRAYREKP